MYKLHLTSILGVSHCVLGFSSEVDVGDVVPAERDSAGRALALPIGDAVVDALLAEKVTAAVDDNALEAHNASRALEHFL